MRTKTGDGERFTTIVLVGLLAAGGLRLIPDIMETPPSASPAPVAPVEVVDLVPPAPDTIVHYRPTDTPSPRGRRPPPPPLWQGVDDLPTP